MRLTSYTNYALRTLQIAALRHPALSRVDDVVLVHGMARPHVAKIVHELGRAGFLRTVRGRGGGFGLGRPAEQIVIGDVVRLTEGRMAVVECFEPETNTCPLIGICRLSRALNEATRAFMAVLDGITVQDISANRAQLLDRISPLADDMADTEPQGAR
ncbi:MAG: Rrf2 family transcriptional regulator [Rhodobacterales bacterium]|nr:Rrf2 family transcriptional regulator [Rhodobacterales bacterium]